MNKEFNVGDQVAYSGDAGRRYIVEGIYGENNHAPSQGKLYIIALYGKRGRGLSRLQYTLTQEMADRDLTGLKPI